ncbi:endoplasmic oxidoreductin-1 [Microbotryomycetes sp. JL221]|nr:endoplasmic oxidoreductin-1 [Microbotryomycetes sp. JL221]
MRLSSTQSSIVVAALVVSQVSALSNLDKPRAAFLQDVLEGEAANQKYCKLSGEIQDACCDYATVEQTNDQLFDELHNIVSLPFFRYHKVDLYRECPFWHEDGSCMNRACGVETTDESEVPERWRAQALSQVKPVHAPPTHTQLLNDDGNFCVLEDELDSQGVFVDLLDNPERFTGYAGASSSKVWKAIYEENCFAPVPFIDPARAAEEGGSGFAPLNSFGMISRPSLQPSWGEDEKRLIGNLAGPRDGGEDICLEKRVFYRVISGLHASISIHICDDYLDQKTGLWAPNLECFVTRIGQHPERLQNVYFTYVLLLRALAKSGDSLRQALVEHSADTQTIDKFKNLVSVSTECPGTFDETSMFSGPSAQILKDEFKTHFRNISQIMDCVGCDKCRLWGKLQVTGLGTALKLLFSTDTETSIGTTPVLSRGEVVAFVNTLHRLSESLSAVERFRGLWALRGANSALRSTSVVTPTVSGSTRDHAPSSFYPSGEGKRNLTLNSRPADSADLKSLIDRLVNMCKDGLNSCLDIFAAARRRSTSDL